MRSLLLALALSCSVVVAPAPAPDTEFTPIPYVTAGAGGLFYFKMVPSREHYGVGTVYRVTEAGADEPVWSVSGWYSFTTYLSDGGRYLVRIGNWPTGSGPSESDLAIAFYDKGTLLAEYSTKSLIKEPDRVPRSICHYSFWKSDAPSGFVRTPEGSGWSNNWFQFVTSDDVRYTFDRRTGQVVSQEPYEH